MIRKAELRAQLATLEAARAADQETLRALRQGLANLYHAAHLPGCIPARPGPLCSCGQWARAQRIAEILRRTTPPRALDMLTLPLEIRRMIDYGVQPAPPPEDTR